MSKWKELEPQVIKLKTGESFEGKFIDHDVVGYTNKETGKTSDLHRYNFVDAEGNPFVYFGDAGFRQKAKLFQENDFIKVEKLEKVKLDQNRECNNYKIYLREDAPF